MRMEKPGRNDPCYCGSGKKYKKCHLPREREEHIEGLDIHDRLSSIEQFHRDLIEIHHLKKLLEEMPDHRLDEFAKELSQLPLRELLAKLEEQGATSPAGEIDALLEKKRATHWFSGIEHYDELTGVQTVEGISPSKELHLGMILDEYVRRQHPDVMIYSDAQDKLDDLYDLYDEAEGDVASAHALLLMWDHILDTFGPQVPGTLDTLDEWTGYFQYELPSLLEDLLTLLQKTPQALKKTDHTRIIKRIARALHKEPMAAALLALASASPR